MEKYNRNHPLQLPPITPHICRHTYCSNMAKMGISPKTLQYLMGHADISKLENGTRNPSVNLLKRLAEGMGMALKIEFVPKQNI